MKAGRRVLKKDVEKLLHVLRGLEGGTQEDFWNAAVQASEIQEQIHRTSPLDTTEAVTKMAVPEGRTLLGSYVEGVRRQIRGTPPRLRDPFRLAVPRKVSPPIDSVALEKGVRRAMERRGKKLEDVVRKSGVSRVPLRERAKRSKAMEEDLLRQLREQKGRRLDLFGRKIGA